MNEEFMEARVPLHKSHLKAQADTFYQLELAITEKKREKEEKHESVRNRRKAETVIG